MVQAAWQPGIPRVRLRVADCKSGHEEPRIKSPAERSVGHVGSGLRAQAVRRFAPIGAVLLRAGLSVAIVTCARLASGAAGTARPDQETALWDVLTRRNM